MSTHSRRERDRETRRARIVQEARNLAHEEGWSAVTVRRIAAKIEYSQPVLYSHFPDKNAIVRAVALEGFVELTQLMRRARVKSRSARGALRAVTRAYLDFAAAQPALYEAMFNGALGVECAADSRPAELVEAFAEVVATVEPLAGRLPVGPWAEVYWSTLHGIASLARDGRLPPAGNTGRRNVVDRLFATLEG